MIPGYPICLASSSASGTAVTTNGANTLATAPSGVASIPGNMLQVGSIIRATLRGIITTSASPATLTWAVLVGAAVASAIGASATLVASQTNVRFECVIEGVVRTVGTGTTATLFASARFHAGSCLATNQQVMLPLTGATAAGTGFDSTISNAITITANWGATGQSLTVESSLIEVFQ